MKLLSSMSAISLALLSTSTLAADVNFTSKLAKGDALVVFQNVGSDADLKFLDRDTRKQLQRAIKTDSFTGKYGKTLELIAPIDSKYSRIVVVGLGESNELTAAKMAKLGGNIHAKLEDKKVATVSLAFESVKGKAKNSELAAQFAHGANLRDYTFEVYKKEPQTFNVTYNIDVADKKTTSKRYQQLLISNKVYF